MGWEGKLIFWIIPLVALVILVMIYFGDNSLFEELKMNVGGILDTSKKFLPDVKLGEDELQANKPTIPEEQFQAIEKLKQIILSMKTDAQKNTQSNCFGNYLDLNYLNSQGPPLDYGTGGGLPALGSTIIELKEENGDTYLKIKGIGPGGNWEYSNEKLERVTPCVIAGADNVAENFYRSFINTEKAGSISNYYLDVDQITIFQDGTNKITFTKESQSITNEIKDGGWLFTPDGNRICFFPTADYWWAEADDEGLEERFFDSSSDSENIKSIPTLINQKKLALCSGSIEESEEPVLSSGEDLR
ncbi:hypothetical protein J4437_03155 [Candidatus Woesearchaeota archaeon]|nr:hypothetical protein [Candidatus Woesearchaeota archaeon]